ncbi:MAG: hypothetical protein ACE5I5_19700 [Candidatus Heimdallarchaeota archaeon]
MKKELHTILAFNIPFAIPVPDGIYTVRIGGREAKIAIIRVQREQIVGTRLQASGTMQLSFDKYGRSAYSHVRITLPWKINLKESGRKPLLLGDIPPRHKAKEVALRFLNRFIEVVRYITEEYWLEPVRYQDTLSLEILYSDGTKEWPAGYVLLDTGTGGVMVSTGPAFKIPKKKLEQINKVLLYEKQMEIDRILILNAKDAVLKEDFRLAILEAVTALEVVLYRFIRIRGGQLGIRKEKLDNFIINVGLTGNFVIVLKMLTQGMETIDKETITPCRGAIKIRNNILHKGLMSVSSTDTESRIIAIEKMISYLKKLLEKIT